MICIIDYDVGNIGSIENMIKKIGHECVISRDPIVIKNAKKLLLPGVGSFDYAMNKLEEFNLIEILNEEVLINKKPILGICLGMQLMTKGSDEGLKKGLGWIDAFTNSFRVNDLKVPHMGWNIVNIKKDSVLVNDFFLENRFYFVHSFFVDCKNKEDILYSTNYGLEFVSGFLKENICGVQFHPEKSHKFGKKLFENFCSKEYC